MVWAALPAAFACSMGSGPDLAQDTGDSGVRITARVGGRPQKPAGSEVVPSAPELAIPLTCGDGVCGGERGENFGNCPRDCQTLDHRADYFAALLASRSFAVDVGAFDIFEAEDCADVVRCFYNNPTSPYGIPLVPPGPGEPHPDPGNWLPRPPGMEHLNPVYRLRPDEAIVWIGTTPPECPYFSFTNYVFIRTEPDSEGGPPFSGQTIVFASLGESENQVTLRTSAHPGESPFGRECVVIATPDRGVDGVIRSALEDAGFPGSIVNTLPFPRFQADGITPKVRLGYDPEGDVLRLLMRIAHPDAPVEGTTIRAWLANTGSRVFRVRPMLDVPLDPFPLPPRRTPGTGESEEESSLLELVRRIQDAHAELPSETRVAFPSPMADGDFCLENLTPCNGDCRDTPYMGAMFKLGDAPEAIIVAGRNHETSGKAAYVNVTATRVLGGIAFHSVVMRDLVSSADVYLPHHPDRNNLWQTKFSRDCRGEPFCYEVTEEHIATDEWLAVLVRAYLEPATGTSAKTFPLRESELVFPRVIKVNCAEGCGPAPRRSSPAVAIPMP